MNSSSGPSPFVWISAAAAALILIALTLWIRSGDGPQSILLASGSISVEQLGDSSNFGFTPADGALRMPVKIIQHKAPAPAFRFTDTLELFLPHPLELENLVFIRLTTAAFEGDFVKFEGNTYRVYPSQKTEPLLAEPIPAME